jgi:Winged helix DNA-binding domain
MTDLRDADLRQARAAAQRLHRPAARGGVGGLVAYLLAVQAQDIVAAPLALRARAAGLTATAVDAARKDRSVVRAWGPRGTLHLIANEDLDWLLPLLTAARPAYPMRRLRQEGVTGAAEELVRVTERALHDQGPLTKPELGARLAQGGVVAQGQGIVHLAALAAAHGRVLLGPDRDGKPTYVHTADWIGRRLPTRVDRDRALAELARRYLQAHAPAGPADLATWSGLGQRDADAAWALIGAELTEAVHDGRPLWTLRSSRRARAGPAGVALLPAFDEYLLGWRGRSLVLPEVYARRVAPGGGIIHPVVVAHGLVVGTWRRTGRTGPVTTALFEPGSPDADQARSLADALQAEAADVVRFTRADG